MNYLPESIRRLIEHFDALPGIGPKHATRLAFFLLYDKSRSSQFTLDLEAALKSVRFCSVCQTITDKELCNICTDTKRSQKIICVVTHVQDIEPIERTGKHSGVYHVLHGTVNPIEGITPDHIKVKELLQRIKKNSIQEVILALDATSDGEATMLYLAKVLHEAGVTVTKLARGIPIGSNIEYTDEVTLSSALEGRKKV